MYSDFDIKKEQELIVLNYYILMNLDGIKFNKSIREIANELDINKSRVQKLMIELQAKGIIKKINSTCKSKGTYLYENKQRIGTKSNTDFGTEMSCKNNSYNEFIGTDLRTDFNTDFNINEDNKSNKYREVITDVFDDINKVQIDTILGIQNLETIELDLFESILRESALRAKKNPITYASTALMNTIKDNIKTLKDREHAQYKRIEDNSISNNKKKFDYMDNSESDDFEMLARLTRER